MTRKASQLRKFPIETRDALAQYLAELEKAYPLGSKACQILSWAEYGTDSYLVKIAPPPSEKQWRKLSQHMAKIGTRILAESDQFFILTT
ncbi:MAG: hypothetical protein FJ147_14910 [Deltaproteobacteria bacterium]|nr:hypothetical protein [Deltaproteobacteria bacterium]